MSIPLIKQRLTTHILRQQEPEGGPARPQPQPSRPPVKPSKAGRGPVALLALAALLSVAPVSAQLDTDGLYVEGFEDLDVGNTPQSVLNQYTYQFVGTGSALAVSSPTIEGDRALRISPSTGNSLATFNGVNGDYCNAVGGIVFSVRLDALPTSGTNKFGITGYNGVGGDDFNPTTDGNTFVYLAIGTTGTASMVIENTPSVVDGTTTDVISGLTIAPDTNYNFHLTCPAEGTTGTFRILETTTTLDAQRSVSRAANGGSNAADDRFTAVALATQTPVWIDEISFYEVREPGSIFCANPVSQNFAYTYVEDVEYDPDIDDNFAGTSDGFIFEGDATNSEYLAKGFDTGGVAMAVNFTIEAAVEFDQRSLFRAAFTTGGSGSPSALTKGDGTDGGNFDFHVGARFEEVLTGSNDWEIAIYENVGGTGYNRIGAGILFGDPYSPTAFRFEVDSRDLTATIYAEGNVLMTRNIDSAFADDGEVWFDQWFVGKGIDNIVNADARTYLNNNDGDADSTCIFDLIGGAVAEGDQGTTPHSQVRDSGDGDGGGGGIGNGDEFLDSPYFWLFFWIVLYNILVGALSWATRAGFGGIVYAVGTLSIYIAGILWYGTDTVEVWPVIVIVAFSVAMLITAVVRR